MSWSFSKTNATPKDVQAHADAYFGQPYIGSMNQPERSIVQLVHTQICLAAAAMPPGYRMSVSAYGSQSTVYGNPGEALNSVTVGISYALEAKEEPKSEQAPEAASAAEPSSQDAPEAVTGVSEGTGGTPDDSPETTAE